MSTEGALLPLERALLWYMRSNTAETFGIAHS